MSETSDPAPDDRTDPTPAPTADVPGAHGSGAGGANLSRVRAHNERLLLTLLRREPLSRAELARRTGLSAQTVSLIVRALREEGLIRSGDPVRGRVGQPSVPLTLEPRGAWFAGLKIGRRSAELALIDFAGDIVATRSTPWRWPDPDAATRFVAREWPGLTEGVPPERLHGLGVAMPFAPWQWPERLGAPDAVMERWRDHDVAATLGALTGLPVLLENDATAACGAELTFGDGGRTDFAYFFIGFFVGGGIVLDASLYRGRHGNAAAFGSLPVPDPDRPGHLIQLLDAASLHVLESLLREGAATGDAAADAMAGASDTAIRDADSPLWRTHADRVERWERRAARALAAASLSIASVVEIDTVVIDGVLPAEVRRRLCERTDAALAALDTRGIETPRAIEGSIGANARTLGAARLPLFARFLLDRGVLTRAGGRIDG